MRFFTLIGATALLASQAFGFNVTVGHTNVTDVNMLAPALQKNAAGPDGDACINQCNTVQNQIQACNGNATCLCTDKLGGAMQSCEQCLFLALIAQNIPPSDPLVGSQALLSAFTTACAATPSPNITLQKLALTVPPNWNGPQALHLNTAETVIAVIAATLLGGTSFFLLVNIE